MQSQSGPARVVRRVAAALGVLFLTVVGSLALALGVPATPALADSGDVIDSMQIDYTVTPEGVLQVKETIVYRFATSGRHGIYRNLVTREPYLDSDRKDTGQDQIYDISNVAVSSPSGASAQFTNTTTKSDDDRDQSIQLKIGSANETISTPTQTYVISYDVRGALRHFSDHSELFWDTTGSGWDASMTTVSIRATVPEGVTQTDCFTGAQGSKTPCTSHSVEDGVGVFTQSALAPQTGVTIVAGITAGVVSNDTPIVVKAPDLLQRAGLGVPALVGAGVVTLAVPVAAGVYARTGNKDERFPGPPGTIPPGGATAGNDTGKNTLRDDQIPVAFAPPRIPPAGGGYLIDATINTLETTATLIDLAVRGALKIIDQDGTKIAELVSREPATAPHEKALLHGLFQGGAPGQTVVLERGKVGDRAMYKAHTAHRDALQKLARDSGWYVRQPSANRTAKGLNVGKGLFWAFFIVVFLGFHSFSAVFLSGAGFLKAAVIGVPVLAVVLGLWIWQRVSGRGRRSGVGRALTDQVVGFERYLATAEANQLRFEEGEDIFSRYLPWAIALDLAERWQKICAQLIEAGRIPEPSGWYVGPSLYYNPFFFSSFSSSMASTFSPPPAPAGSGGGGGSSSGFGGGGFSGGGGGGGGGGSW